MFQISDLKKTRMTADQHGSEGLPHAAFPDVLHVPGEEAVKGLAVVFELNERAIQGRKCGTRQEPVGRADAEDVEQEHGWNQNVPTKHSLSRPTLRLVAHANRVAPAPVSCEQEDFKLHTSDFKTSDEHGSTRMGENARITR